MSKPSRSDEIEPEMVRQRISEQVQEYFDVHAPHRAPKPSRSEPSSQNMEWPSQSDIPEHAKLRELEASPLILHTDGGIVNGDDSVETDYYKDLAMVELGQHHTTGTGFIKVEESGNSAFHLKEDDLNSCFSAVHNKCNPATNDWQPSPTVVFPHSDKPSRSDPQ